MSTSTIPRIALLPGDGIGQEVLDAALRVLDASGFKATYTHADIGWRYWVSEGNALPERTIRVLEESDAALFGAITSKPHAEAQRELSPELHAKGFVYTSPIVQLRQHFELYLALRPCRSIPGIAGPSRDDIDIIVCRENTEGLYGGIEWRGIPAALAAQMGDPESGHPGKMRRWIESGLDDLALSTRFVSRAGCARIVRAAFEIARNHQRRSVTLLEKPNVLRATGGLMCEVFRAIASEFPEIEAHELNIDAACMRLITHPHHFDVIVAENMFGDIVSDLCAGLVGGLGVTPSANIGDRLAIFEPTHGSAPDIAGKGIANPIAMILSACMMLDSLNEHDTSHRIRHAISQAIQHGQVNTPDMIGQDAKGTTQSITDAIIHSL
jgi:3-isopropylmalate dehydrogenase